MWFMAKSALCIGVVTALAAGASGGGDLGSAVSSGGRETAAVVARACARSADCAALGARAVSALLDQDRGMPDAPVRAAVAGVSDLLASRPAAVAPAADPAVPLPPERPRRRSDGTQT